MPETRDDETGKPAPTRDEEAGTDAHQDAPEQAEEDVETEAATARGGDTAPEKGPGITLLPPVHDPRAKAPPVHDPRDAAPAATGGDGDRPWAMPGSVREDDTADAPGMGTPGDEMPANEAGSGRGAGTPPPSDGAPADPPRRGGFVPIFLGGVIAAALGFGAAMVAYPPVDTYPLETRLDEQTDALSELRDQVAQGPDLSALDGMQADLAGVQDSLSGLQDSLSGLQDGLSELQSRVDTLAGRVEELEKRPVAENAPQEAIDAYEDELARLQQAMQDQRAEIEQMVAESQDLKADAAATARDTQVRAALVRLRAALDDGATFEGPLDTLRELGLEIPDALARDASAGIPTLARLRDDYPAAAREALEATRDGSLGGSFGDFLKNQLGARSLTPQEGDDPDSILSRAEAALRDGRIRDALVELDGLPEPALEEMNSWTTMARSRAEALEAAETLSAETK